MQSHKTYDGLGSVSIKMYDRFSKILSIETKSNDKTFLTLLEGSKRDGSTSHELAQLKKNSYSLLFLTDNLKASNKIYLEFILVFDNKENGIKSTG